MTDQGTRKLGQYEMLRTLAVWRHESNQKSLAIPTSLGESVIIAVIALVALNSVSNAGDCSRSKSAVATSLEAHQKADEKTEVEA